MMDHSTAETKISVIIPVHNAGDHIFRCIDSLKAQTFKDLEFIFVDDRSEDDSMDAVFEWAGSDPRVKIFQNDLNLGEGGSRNRGINEAQGLYINTIDPDDCVADDFYELLYAKAVETSADIVKGTRIKVEEGTLKELKPRSNLNDLIDKSLARGEPLYLNLHYEHTTIIFKRSILDDSTRYGKSPNACDSTFLLRLCAKATSYAVENSACYYYIQRGDSATAEYSYKRSKNELISLEEQVDHFIENGPMDDHAYAYCANRFYSYSARFVHAYEKEVISPQEKNWYIRTFKDQILRIPEYSRLYETVPEIYAITELDMVPAPRLNTDVSICREEVPEWMTFILAFEGTHGHRASEKFRSLLSAYFKKKKNAGASPETLKKEMIQIGSGVNGFREKMVFRRIAKDALKRVTNGK